MGQSLSEGKIMGGMNDYSNRPMPRQGMTGGPFMAPGPGMAKMAVEKGPQQKKELYQSAILAFTELAVEVFKARELFLY